MLGLPYAFSYLTWAGGLVFLSLAFVASLYTSWLLAALHEEPDGRRHNRYVDLGVAVLGALHLPSQAACSTRWQLAWPPAVSVLVCRLLFPGSHVTCAAPAAGHVPAAVTFLRCMVLWLMAAGPRLGAWVTAPFQWSVMVGLGITYTVTAGQSFQVKGGEACRQSSPVCMWRAGYLTCW